MWIEGQTVFQALATILLFFTPNSMPKIVKTFPFSLIDGTFIQTRHLLFCTAMMCVVVYIYVQCKVDKAMNQMLKLEVFNWTENLIKATRFFESSVHQLLVISTIQSIS